MNPFFSTVFSTLSKYIAFIALGLSVLLGLGAMAAMGFFAGLVVLVVSLVLTVMIFGVIAMISEIQQDVRLIREEAQRRALPSESQQP